MMVNMHSNSSSSRRQRQSFVSSPNLCHVRLQQQQQLWSQRRILVVQQLFRVVVTLMVVVVTLMVTQMESSYAFTTHVQFAVTSSSAIISQSPKQMVQSLLYVSSSSSSSDSVSTTQSSSSSLSSDDDDNDDDDDDSAVLVTWLQDDATPDKKQPPRGTVVVLGGDGSKLRSKIQNRIGLVGRLSSSSSSTKNTKKRESDMDRKRRQLMFIKERQRERKRMDRIRRPIPIAPSDQRIPLDVFQPGMRCNGVCISLTTFGAYIDIGTECDGLLHVGQMYRVHDEAATTTSGSSVLHSNNFVHHPRQIVQPGDEITVTIRSIHPGRKKLHFTLLPWDIVQQQLDAEQVRKATRSLQSDNDDDDDDWDTVSSASNTRSNDNSNTAVYTDRITLDDLNVDDELWGEIRRVTDFGAYVEVGAVVDGFLHFMDHPTFNALDTEYSNHPNRNQPPPPRHPTTFMKYGDRIRVWVADIDRVRNRIKLTAHRPSHLPGPRREL